MTSNHRKQLRLGLATIALAVFLTPASAAEWGAIKGKFLYQGKPKVEAIQPSKDPEYCSKHNLVTETVSISDKGELQNVFVYLYLARGKKVEIHPDYDPAKVEPKVLDNHLCRFEPHAMTLWTAQKLQVTNTDPGLGHNTNAGVLLANTGFNETVPNDKPLEKTFTKSEPIPSKISCSIHPWMNAFILIRDNPYMAVSGKDGSFEIKNVPAGKQAFVFWHEAKGNLRDLKVGKLKADRKGQVQLEVPAGKTLDLGEIVVTPVILGQ